MVSREVAEWHYQQVCKLMCESMSSLDVAELTERMSTIRADGDLKAFASKLAWAAGTTWQLPYGQRTCPTRLWSYAFAALFALTVLPVLDPAAGAGLQRQLS